MIVEIDIFFHPIRPTLRACVCAWQKSSYSKIEYACLIRLLEYTQTYTYILSFVHIDTRCVWCALVLLLLLLLCYDIVCTMKQVLNEEPLGAIHLLIQYVQCSFS